MNPTLSNQVVNNVTTITEVLELLIKRISDLEAAVFTLNNRSLNTAIQAEMIDEQLDTLLRAGRPSSSRDTVQGIINGMKL